MEDRARQPTVAYLGPPGTFTEEALLSQADLASADCFPVGTPEDVLETVATGKATLGLVPIENSIVGTVSPTLDALVFEHNLLIQRELVLDIHLHLMALPGATLEGVSRVVSYPVALGQCRGWIAANLPGVETDAANSTAEAARHLGEGGSLSSAVIAPALAAELYGLEVLSSDVEDHGGNQTRFVLMAKEGIPPATGHDRTTLACFQRSDKPGSLLAILEQFAARSINLTRLESRPTREKLGHYYFVVDLEGHVADEIVADCLRNLHAELPSVKFLGSYPAAGEAGPRRRHQAEAAWRAAEDWVDALRSQVQPGRRGTRR